MPSERCCGRYLPNRSRNSSNSISEL
jgi:hypothetical protein